MMKRQVYRCALLLAGLTPTACNLAPPYHRPETATAPIYKEQAGWKMATGQLPAVADHWWERFNDPALNQLETTVPQANQNLQAALARYDEARAALLAAGANLLPTVNLNVNATREQASETTKAARSDASLAGQVHNLAAQNGAGTSGGSSGRAYNDFQAGLDVSYDIDLWGRLRNAAAAAGAEARASRADMAALILELQAEVASGYFTIRADDAQADILAQSIRDFQAQLDYTKHRYEGGIALVSDVDQAETQLDSARAQREQTLLDRAQAEHALAVLEGAAPGAFTVTPAPFVANVLPVDKDVPSALLERRPDIVAADERVFEANAEIGEARAAWYPDITLGASGGYESEKLSKLFGAPSLFWSIGPSLTQPIFEGGAIEALNMQARAAYREAVANYRQTVLGAYQETEDNLAGIRQLGLAAQDEQAAAEAANRALTQANARYHGGIDTYLNVAIQENNVLQARLATTQAQLAEMTADIRLIKALGGGIFQQPPGKAPK